MSSKPQFPIISVANIHSDFDAISKKLFEASCKWGFFIATDHGISNADKVFELSKAFFDLPLEVKTEKMVDETAIGYDGGKKFTSFAASEAILFGTPAGGVLSSKNLPEWWDHEKRAEIEKFKAECYDLSITMMSGFAKNMGLDEEYFTRIHQHKAPGHTLRCIKYPQLEEQPDSRQPRLSTHTDWGSLTFVFTKQAGLEIQDPNNDWFHIPVVPDGIVVNIGDALSLWTGKTLKSTLHRITWDNLPRNQDRYSLAYFSQPNNDALLQSIMDAGKSVGTKLTYEDYYNVRYRLTYGAHSDTKSGKKMLADVDPAIAKAVHELGVADAGALAFNEIVA
ncbi:Clavaminate synthase-like protein [Thozetella sp. PMI_491]|nr:Clavaminate synthase-like protein [Thozetella sp. PMI_491]